ncbi:MAG: hypothetical protein BMS9Abin34_531 [Patescibacteria group bacterium]|nr:MAG: hypothetical protein BMS9Abin34_531 [Patescibacteria group bacterium]
MAQAKTQPPKQASTQEHLDILDIQGNLILLKNGSVALVMETTSVNFNLLSEREQDAMIAAYSSMLNSLSFPLQILVRSRKLDISNYLKWVGEKARSPATQANPYLQKKIDSYKGFIVSLVQKGEVLDKRFYMVIPYSGGVTLSRPGVLDLLLGKKSQSPRVNKTAVLGQAKTDLEPKKEHLVKQLNRLGIKSRQLTTPELIELFYEIYNPEQARVQHIAGGAGNYTSVLVEPAIGGKS